MDLKVKAIVLSSKNWGDKDKLVTLFCLDKGVITAKIRGVRSPKAKLKFAKEPFCFADFVIVSKGDFFTITSASCIDTFYDITKNYDAFMVATEIVKIVKKVAMRGQENNKLFVDVLNSLKILAYDNALPDVVMAKFLLDVFYREGYGFAHHTCTNCGTKLGDSRFLDLDTGQILCAGCKTDFCVRITFAQSSILRIISTTGYDRLASLKLDEINVSNILTILKKRIINF